VADERANDLIPGTRATSAPGSEGQYIVASASVGLSVGGDVGLPVGGAVGCNVNDL
jgi:hypothetical protein